MTGGAFDTIGHLRLFCWLRAIKAPPVFGGRGRLFVVGPLTPERETISREVDLEIRRVAPPVAALDRLRFPERPPRVEPVFDTSDFWEHAVLRVTLDDTTATLDLAMCSSGFDGEDAEELREVFRRLLDLTEVAPVDWYNLVGRPS